MASHEDNDWRVGISGLIPDSDTLMLYHETVKTEDATEHFVCNLEGELDIPLQSVVSHGVEPNLSFCILNSSSGVGPHRLYIDSECSKPSNAGLLNTANVKVDTIEEAVVEEIFRQTVNEHFVDNPLFGSPSTVFEIKNEEFTVDDRTDQENGMEENISCSSGKTNDNLIFNSTTSTNNSATQMLTPNVNLCGVNNNCVVLLDRINIDRELKKLTKTRQDDNTPNICIRNPESDVEIHLQDVPLFEKNLNEQKENKFPHVNYNCVVILNRVDVECDTLNLSNEHTQGQTQLKEGLGKMSSSQNVQSGRDSDLGAESSASGDIFRCPECPMTFVKAVLLNRHGRETHNTGIRKCTQCSYSTLRKSNLVDHLRNHHGGVFTRKVYKCDPCNKSFKDKWSFKYHTDTIHSDARPFTCKVCDMSFKVKSHLRRHLSGHDEPSIKCGICGMMFKRKDTLKYHLRAVHADERECQTNFSQNDTSHRDWELLAVSRTCDDDIFRCPQCPLTFVKAVHLDRHCHERHNPRIRNCIQCSFSTLNIRTLADHLQNSHGGVYKCNPCNKSYKYKISYQYHNDSVHSNGTSLKCNICNKSFKVKDDLRRHLPYHDEPRFKCKNCGKMFKQNGDLKKHLRTHAAKQNNQCRRCWKSFSVEHELKKHMGVHASDKKYSCHHCSKTFGTIQGVQRHIEAVHSTEKKYACQICQKKFATKMSVHRHLVVHTGEKSYQCRYCPERFAFNSSRYTHMQSHSDSIKKYTCRYCPRIFLHPRTLKRHEVKAHVGDLLEN